ncbi:SusC/RagA family TonB-linked outer membrane protein [Spongiimicrobium sp. 3-5]|uniref:SusC/RagA family TonB-linked outer membrane protein n=1 Tax=Spongiimicrobium sp. 3-5 TaxID=3332596 RepID=UPI00397F8265
MKVKLLIFMTILSLYNLKAQNQVQGKITGIDQLPLIGVTILVQGTNTGTSSDFDGNYSIRANTGDVLVYSYLGYKTKLLTVNSNILNIVLLEDLSELDEVVVVAFGTSTKKALTGALEVVTTEEISKQPQANFTNALQGLAPGLQVFEGNGQPGSGAGFRIRGIGSLLAGADPLIVLDGAVFNGGLSQINPNDIESINVLKDAASASIYGSRAANGVILINLKKGRNQKTVFTINTEAGFTENTNPNDFRLMNAAEYVEYYREALINNGRNPDDPSTGFYLPINQQFDTDWVNEAFKTGSFKKYDFSARGGNESTSFYAGLGYTDQEGTVVGTGFERINGTLNLDHNLNDKIDIGVKMQLNYRNRDNLISEGGRSGQLSGAFNTAPTESIFGTPETDPALVGAGFNFDIPSNAQHNSVATAVLNSNNSESWSVNSTLNLGYNFTPKFRAEVLGNYYYASFINKETIGKAYLAETEDGNSEEARFSENTFNFVGSLAYNTTIGEDHKLGIKAGFETTRFRSNALEVARRGFTFANLNDVGLASGPIDPSDVSSSFDGNAVAGFFGRVNYSYKNKAFLEGSLRRDGASNFGPDSRWGTFGAVGLSYVFSEDLFPNSEWINNLKLRGSYGSSGNNDFITDDLDFGNFLWRDLFALEKDFAINPTDFLPGITVSFAPNRSLRWEKNLQLDVGLDFGLFNNRLSGSIDYFRRVSEDLLFELPLSLTTGFEKQAVNSNAELLNTGFEISLSAYPVRTDNFSWRADANIAFYDQEIQQLPEEVVFSDRIWQEGERSDNFFYQRYAGVDPATGDPLYLDVDGNVISDYDGEQSRAIVGQRSPDTYGSVTNTFTYKDISLSFMVFFNEGNQEYFNLGETLNGDGQNFPANQWAIALNRWQQPGDITNVPRVRLNNPNGGLESTRFLYDASYVRLQNVTLGYAIPREVVRNIGLENISFRLSGQNLWTLTDFPGYDPTSESYPLPRTITFGVNLSF